MKKFKNLLIALLFATLCGINAYAYDFEVDGIYYKYQSIQKKTVAVTSRVYGIETYSGSVVIPSIVSYLDVEYNVTEIDYSAFSNCDELEKIEIPKGMILIGDNAFKDVLLWRKLLCRALSIESENGLFTIVASRVLCLRVINVQLSDIWLSTIRSCQKHI